MAVDQGAVPPASAGVMDLHEVVPGPALEIRLDVAAMIDQIGVEIGDVAEPAAAGALQNARQKFRLVHSPARDGTTVVTFSSSSGTFIRSRSVSTLRATASIAALVQGRAARWPIETPPALVKQRCSLNQGGLIRSISRASLPNNCVKTFGAAGREIEPMRNQRKMRREKVEFGELFGRGVEIMIGDDFQKIDSARGSRTVGREIPGDSRGRCRAGQGVQSPPPPPQPPQPPPPPSRLLRSRSRNRRRHRIRRTLLRKPRRGSL